MSPKKVLVKSYDNDVEIYLYYIMCISFILLLHRQPLKKKLYNFYIHRLKEVSYLFSI